MFPVLSDSIALSVTPSPTNASGASNPASSTATASAGEVEAFLAVLGSLSLLADADDAALFVEEDGDDELKVAVPGDVPLVLPATLPIPTDSSEPAAPLSLDAPSSMKGVDAALLDADQPHHDAPAVTELEDVITVPVDVETDLFAVAPNRAQSHGSPVPGTDRLSRVSSGDIDMLMFDPANGSVAPAGEESFPDTPLIVETRHEEDLLATNLRVVAERIVDQYARMRGPEGEDASVTAAGTDGVRDVLSDVTVREIGPAPATETDATTPVSAMSQSATPTSATGSRSAESVGVDVARRVSEIARVHESAAQAATKSVRIELPDAGDRTSLHVALRGERVVNARIVLPDGGLQTIARQNLGDLRAALIAQGFEPAVLRVESASSISSLAQTLEAVVGANPLSGSASSNSDIRQEIGQESRAFDAGERELPGESGRRGGRRGQDFEFEYDPQPNA